MGRKPPVRQHRRTPALPLVLVIESLSIPLVNLGAQIVNSSCFFVLLSFGFKLRGFVIKALRFGFKLCGTTHSVLVIVHRNHLPSSAMALIGSLRKTAPQGIGHGHNQQEEGRRAMQRTPNTNNNCPKLIRVAEFAERSGLSKKQVTKMILQKKLRARKLNDKRNSPWLVPATELDRLVEEVAA